MIEVSGMNVVDAFDKFDYFRGFFLESIAISYLEDGKINCHVSLRRGGEYGEDYGLDVPKVANITVGDVSSYRLYQKPGIMRLPILTGVHLVDIDGKLGIDFGDLPSQPKDAERFLSSKLFFIGRHIDLQVN